MCFRKGILLILLGIFFFTATGASIIDKETKEGVLALEKRLQALSEDVRRRDAEVLRRLDEVTQSLIRIRSLENAISGSVKESLPPVVPEPPAQEQATEDLNPLLNRLKNTESFSLLALLLSGITLCSIILLIVFVRREESRIRSLLWKSEIDSLRETMSQTRPHLTVQTDAHHISVLNNSTTTAEEIRIYLGPTPSTMKQKMKSIPRLQAGEKVEIPLPPTRSDDFLYATLEYKNPQTGRLLKEQFSLKVDRMTGELIPIHEAS